jgi:hypothetical protein
MTLKGDNNIWLPLISRKGSALTHGKLKSERVVKESSGPAIEVVAFSQNGCGVEKDVLIRFAWIV